MDIIYIMNVEWNWIKQRPHFLAEELGKNHNVYVFYQYKYRRKGLQKNESINIIRKPVYVLPLGGKIKVFDKINSFIWRKKISKCMKKNDKHVFYLTMPNQLDYVKKLSGKILYDCMDNHYAFITDPKGRDIYISQEKEIINKASYIICSSLSLKAEMLKRYGSEIKDKIDVVRNGFDGKIIDCFEQESSIKNNSTLKVAYFGTISSWFNFDFLIRSLDDIQDLQYILMGPISDDVTIPPNDRIKYLGTIEHSQLYNAIKDVDCLFMPFVLNDIIEFVDPVKIYEYINFYKNIICVRYNEVERFKDFVFFYNTYDEYLQCIRGIQNDRTVKYSETQRRLFLEGNNWNSRKEQIEVTLKQMMKDDEE